MLSTVPWSVDMLTISFQIGLTAFDQLVYSEYLQLLVALMIGLGVHSHLIFPPSPPHLPTPATPVEWKWLATFLGALEMAESLSKRTPLQKNSSFIFPGDMQPLSSTEKFQPTVSSPINIANEMVGVMDHRLLRCRLHT